jgi:protein-disulfide isomerase
MAEYVKRDEYTTNYTCPYCSEAVQPMIAVTAIDVEENKE